MSHVWMNHVLYECVMSLLWIGHVTQTAWAAARDVSRHREWARRHRHVHRQGVTCEWVMWHVREILHASYHTNEQIVMSHSYRDWFYRMISDFRMISDVYGNGVTCEWVTSHVRKMLHATRMEKVSCHTHIVTVEWIVTLTVKVSCVNTSWHTPKKTSWLTLSVRIEWCMLHLKIFGVTVWMRYLVFVTESCYACKAHGWCHAHVGTTWCVMSHMWIEERERDRHVNAACQVYNSAVRDTFGFVVSHTHAHIQMNLFCHTHTRTYIIIVSGKVLCEPCHMCAFVMSQS